MSAFLEQSRDDRFACITPDLIFDYFEPLLRKEIYDGILHRCFTLTRTILDELEPGQLESKLVKTISLIYMLGQFERLKPTSGELVNIYSCAYAPDEVIRAVRDLIEKKYLFYLKRSNEYLQLKQASGVDIRERIRDTVERQRASLTIKDILNSININSYLYPARYNDEREMTRYFAFVFIDGRELAENVNWKIKSEGIEADGVIYGILPDSEERIPELRAIAQATSPTNRQAIFVIPKHYQQIEGIVREYCAAQTLRDEAGSADRILFDEYQVICEDLMEMIVDFVNGYLRPESSRARYISNGTEHIISRRAALTSLMSDICFAVFPHTPVVNNEVINRNEITTMASNSRGKILAALLRPQLEPNLGLSGSGQDVSIMRSALLRTGVLACDGVPQIQLEPVIEPKDNSERMAYVLNVIERFFMETQQSGAQGFDVLYDRLTKAEYGIGLRRGLIPIYIAVVLHMHRREIILSDRFGSVLPTANLLTQINANPKAYSASYIHWSPDKEALLSRLAARFSDYVVEEERSDGAYDYVANALRRWCMDLPRYSKECRVQADGIPLSGQDLRAIASLRDHSSSHQLLFEQLPRSYGLHDGDISELASHIDALRSKYDALLPSLSLTLIERTKALFADGSARSDSRASLAAVIDEWIAALDPAAFEQLFPDGTHRLLELFKTVSNDEASFIARLARLMTDLRLEDWDDGTLERCLEKLSACKATAEAFHPTHESSAAVETGDGAPGYTITYTTDQGQSVTKRFERIQYGSRGKLLYNQIAAALSSMGQALSEPEKRQIVMEILEKLC